MCLQVKSSLLHMNKNDFHRYFIARSPAEKARGCFGSNMVSKLIMTVQLKKLGYLSFATRIFKAEEQSVNTFVATFVLV